MITGIAHMAVTVKDMEESIRFYTEVLGFYKAFDFKHLETGAPWIEYLSVSHGQFVELFYGGTEDNPWHDDLIGVQHLCLETDNIHAAVMKIRNAGYPIDIDPKQGLDLNWQAWTKDPNGVRIELMQIMPGSPHSSFR